MAIARMQIGKTAANLEIRGQSKSSFDVGTIVTRSTGVGQQIESTAVYLHLQIFVLVIKCGDVEIEQTTARFEPRLPSLDLFGIDRGRCRTVQVIDAAFETLDVGCIDICSGRQLVTKREGMPRSAVRFIEIGKR